MEPYEDNNTNQVASANDKLCRDFKYLSALTAACDGHRLPVTGGILALVTTSYGKSQRLCLSLVLRLVTDRKVIVGQ